MSAENRGLHTESSAYSSNKIVLTSVEHMLSTQARNERQEWRSIKHNSSKRNKPGSSGRAEDIYFAGPVGRDMSRGTALTGLRGQWHMASATLSAMSLACMHPIKEAGEGIIMDTQREVALQPQHQTMNTAAALCSKGRRAEV